MRNRSFAISPGDMYGGEFKMRIAKIVIKDYGIFQIVAIGYFSNPVKSRKLAEQKLKGVGICHSVWYLEFIVFFD